jgi:hypothetical protein
LPDFTQADWPDENPPLLQIRHETDLADTIVIVPLIRKLSSKPIIGKLYFKPLAMLANKAALAFQIRE